MSASDTGGRLTASVSATRREGLVDAGFDLIRAKDPVTIVIFGASGDLAQRKLIPALYHLQAGGYLPERYAVIGFSRTPMTTTPIATRCVAALREQVKGEATESRRRSPDRPGAALPRRRRRQPDIVPGAEGEHRGRSRRERDLPGNRLFYLSVAPEFFPLIVEHLAAAGLIRRQERHGVVARDHREALRHTISRARARSTRSSTTTLDESQIYRIDHYLGKETVQNILSFRFGNSIFEPLFNQKYVDNVQITVAETLGMEGRRGAYYDTRRRAARHGAEPHAAAALPDRDGAAVGARGAVDPRREGEGAARARAADAESRSPPTRCAASTASARRTARSSRAIARRKASTRSRSPRPTSRYASRSTTGAGPACRSSCARASGSPSACPRSRSCSSSRRMHLFRDLVEAATSGRRATDVERPGHAHPARRGHQPLVRLQAARHAQSSSTRSTWTSSTARLSTSARRRPTSACCSTRCAATRRCSRARTRSSTPGASSPRSTRAGRTCRRRSFPNYYPFTDGPDEANRLLEGTQARWRLLAEM